MTRVGEGVATDALLAVLVATLADNKQMLGRRYAEWCTAAPTLESAVAAASMAQDEIGHARSFYPLLEDIAGKSPDADPDARTRLQYAAFLEEAFSSWTDFVAANFLFDTALTVLLDAALESSFGPLGQRARRIHEEETLHWLHGEGWVRRLAATGQAVRGALTGSLHAALPDSLTLFDVANVGLVDDGTVAAGAGALRSRFRDRVNPVLDQSGMPPV